MNVAAGAAFRRVHVAVGVNPDAADGLLLVVMELRYPSQRANGNRMVPTKRNGKHPVFQRLIHVMSHLLAGLGNLVEILGVPVAEMLLLGDLYVDVARILHLVP